LIFKDITHYNKYGIKSKFLPCPNMMAQRILSGEKLKLVVVEENAGFI